MEWGEVETEPEFDAWYAALPIVESAIVDRHVDRLAREGVHLGEPHTRHLSGKLRELRIPLGNAQIRVTYFIAGGRRVVLLTVFPKTRPRERREIERAVRAMERCIAEGHTAEED